MKIPMWWPWQNFDQLVDESHSNVNRDITIVDTHGRRTLRVNGTEETGVYTDQLFRNGLKCYRSWYPNTPKRILVFGVGGGGVFPMLESMYPQARITGVDIDPEVVRLARKHFGLQTLKRTSFIVQDARKFASDNKNRNKYDFIIIDIYIGNDVPEFITNDPFVRAIEKLLKRDGALMINYFSFENQAKKSKILLDKLSKIYQCVNSQRNLRNIFFYCRN